MQDPLPAVGVAQSAVVHNSPPPPENIVAGYTKFYRSYVLALMALVYVVNYLDRQVLGILVPQIKAEFHLSNTQVGVLTGPAFAFIYATLGIPFAIFADRINRRNVIALCVAIFSVTTLFSGCAAKFGQLLLARFGTGIGEAGTSPSISSLLSDVYPPEKRASALAFYSAGLNVGLLVAFFGGGWIAEHYGWRTAFLAAGFPGLVLALVIFATVKEPQRGAIEHLTDHGDKPSFKSVVAFLWRQPSYRWIGLGGAMSAFGSYSGLAFAPLFLKSTHHLTTVQTGLALALLGGVGGAIGTYLAGVFADRYSRRDIRWLMYVPIVATFLAIPFVPFFYLSNNTAVALAAAIVPVTLAASYLGPCYAAGLALAPLRMRAQSTAILVFTVNIIALSLGPLTVGKLSDLLQPVLGAQALRYSLLAGTVTGLIGAACYWRAATTLREDIARAAGA